jgi:hypothetical protein
VFDEDSLGLFLVERAAKNMEMANYLFWYLKVEMTDPRYGPIYKSLYVNLRSCLEQAPAFQRDTATSGAPSSVSPSSARGSLAASSTPGTPNSAADKKNVFSGILNSMKDALGDSLDPSDPASRRTGGKRTSSTDGMLVTMWTLLEEQEKFFLGIMKEQIDARDTKGKKAAKVRLRAHAGEGAHAGEASACGRSERMRAQEKEVVWQLQILFALALLALVGHLQLLFALALLALALLALASLALALSLLALALASLALSSLVLTPQSPRRTLCARS